MHHIVNLNDFLPVIWGLLMPTGESMGFPLPSEMAKVLISMVRK